MSRNNTKSRRYFAFSLCVALCIAFIAVTGMLASAYSANSAVNGCVYTSVTTTSGTQTIALGNFQSGLGLAVSDPRLCRVGWKYLISGTICLTQSIIAQSMFNVYCSILLEWKDILYKLMILYVSLYSLTLVIGINKNNGKDAAVHIMKMIAIFIVATQPEAFFFWMYDFFLNTLNGFSLMLIEGVSQYGGYDPNGNPVYNVNGQLLAENGDICVSPTYGNPPIPGCVCTGNFDVLGHYVPCRVPATPTDIWGEAVRDGSGNILNLAGGLCEPGNPATACPSAGGPAGQACPCRDEASNTVFGNIDKIFSAVIGGEEVGGLIGIGIAAMFITKGQGFFLTILIMVGIVSMFMSFLRIMVTYLTSIMAMVFVMMFTPIFLSMALFSVTKSIFNRWIASIISYTLQPILIIAFLFTIGQAVNIDALLRELHNEHVLQRGAVELGPNGHPLRPAATKRLVSQNPDVYEYPSFYELASLTEEDCLASPGFCKMAGPISGSHTFGWPGVYELKLNAPAFVPNFSISNPANCTNQYKTPCRFNGVDGSTNKTLLECMSEPGICKIDKSGTQGMVSSVLTVVVVWLLINALMAGFMTKIPEIAARMSKFRGYGAAPIVGGRSAALDEVFGESSTLIDPDRLNVRGGGTSHFYSPFGNFFENALNSNNAVTNAIRNQANKIKGKGSNNKDGPLIAQSDIVSEGSCGVTECV